MERTCRREHVVRALTYPAGRSDGKVPCRVACEGTEAKSRDFRIDMTNCRILECLQSSDL